MSLVAGELFASQGFPSALTTTSSVVPKTDLSARDHARTMLDGIISFKAQECGKLRRAATPASILQYVDSVKLVCYLYNNQKECANEAPILVFKSYPI